MAIGDNFNPCPLPVGGGVIKDDRGVIPMPSLYYWKIQIVKKYNAMKKSFLQALEDEKNGKLDEY